MNFQKQVRKMGFDVYKKNQSKITYPRLRTFRREIRCVLSFQAIYVKIHREIAIDIMTGNFATLDFPSFLVSELLSE